MEKSMQKYLDKAEVLIEALPYIQRFNRKIIVVKYGGSAMVDEELKARVIQDVTLLKLVGFKPIIVHGGGKEISKWVGKVGMEPHFINGLRVTDADTMELAEMVLGKVNKSLVQLVIWYLARRLGFLLLTVYGTRFIGKGNILFIYNLGFRWGGSFWHGCVLFCPCPFWHPELALAHDVGLCPAVLWLRGLLVPAFRCHFPFVHHIEHRPYVEQHQ